MTNARFKVVLIDENGSGMDFSGHLGAEVTNARACCRNCSIIVGDCGGAEMEFTPNELAPLNDEASELLVDRTRPIGTRSGSEQ